MTFDSLFLELDKLTKAHITALAEVHPLLALDTSAFGVTAYGASVLAFPHLQPWDFNEHWRLGLLDAFGYLGCHLEQEFLAFPGADALQTSDSTRLVIFE